MQVCPKCQSSVKDGQRFCNICGTNVPATGTVAAPAIPAKVYCEQCGRELNKLMKFCKYCGASQKNFSELASGKATEMIGSPATPTSDMAPSVGGQGATEVISPNTPQPQSTGPTGGSFQTQAIKHESPKPTTEPIVENSTVGFQETPTGGMRPSQPMDPDDPSSFKTLTDQPSTRRITDDLEGPSSGSIYSVNAPTVPVPNPSQEFGQGTSTTDRFSTMSESRPIVPASNSTAQFDAPLPQYNRQTADQTNQFNPANQPNPSGQINPAQQNTVTWGTSPFQPAIPAQAPTQPVGTSPFQNPAQSPTQPVGTSPFHNPAHQPTQPVGTMPLRADQVQYNALPPTAPVTQPKGKSPIMFLAIAAVIVLMLGGGAFGAYWVFIRKPEPVVVTNNTGGPTNNTGGTQPQQQSGDNPGQLPPTSNPTNPQYPTGPTQPDGTKKPDDTQKPNDPGGKTGTGADDQKRQQEEARKQEEAKRLEDQKRQQDQAEQKRLDDQRRQDDERRAADEQRRQDEQRRLDDQRREDQKRAAAEEERKRQESLPKAGTVLWTANVRGRYNVVIRGNSATTQALSGSPIEAQISFTMAIPTRPVRIRLSDKSGKVRIFQSPGPSNGYVTIIQVEGNGERVSFTLQWDTL